MALAIDGDSANAVARRVRNVALGTVSAIGGGDVACIAAVALRSIPLVAARASAANIGVASDSGRVVGAVGSHGALEVAVRISAFVGRRTCATVLSGVVPYGTQGAGATSPLVAASAGAIGQLARDRGRMIAAVEGVGADAHTRRIGAGVANGARGTVRSRRVLGGAGTARWTGPRAAALAGAACVGVAAHGVGLPGAVG